MADSGDVPVAKSNAPADATASQAPAPQGRAKPGKPKYHVIHAKPLPLEVYPLPTFIPHNPLSLLRVAYIIISQFFSGPSSHPEKLLQAYFSSETQSVHVVDPKSVRALWEQGFFGKGSLSRSEPSWLDREKRRRGLVASQTSEEATAKRRQARRQFKLDRARAEREAIEEQLRKEGKLKDSATQEDVDAAVQIEAAKADVAGESMLEDADNEAADVADSVGMPDEATLKAESRPTGPISKVAFSEEMHEISPRTGPEPPEELENQEHLQLTPEESFFLVYGLGALDVYLQDSTRVLSAQELLKLFCQNSTFPPSELAVSQPDNAFLLRYVVYHHFRSLGWVVRPGIKFSVDYLLYNRGPVFSHAEFAIMIMPSYQHPYWTATPERAAQTAKKERKDWWWLHCVNRVQNHVLKTLVLVYVEIPPPSAQDENSLNIGAMLKSYKVREFILRRWAANRNRD